MLRSPAFTIAAILSLAIGIGANASVFSVIDALMVSRAAGGRTRAALVPESRRLRGSQSAFLGAATRPAASGRARRGLRGHGQSRAHPNLTRRGERTGRLVSSSPETGSTCSAYPPPRGCLIQPDDATTVGSRAVAVISYSYWTRAFGQNTSALGTGIRINGTPFTIIGVAARGFDGLSAGERQDAWLPVTMQADARLLGNASISNADPRKPWFPQDGVEWLTIVTRRAIAECVRGDPGAGPECASRVDRSEDQGHSGSAAPRLLRT